MKILKTVALATTILATSTFASANAVKVGGKNGDYNLHFAPPTQKVLQSAWYDYPIETGKGTPDTMQWLCKNPTGVGFLQGNVYAQGSPCDLNIIRGDTGNELLLAVINDKTLERLGGKEGVSSAWAKLSRVANRVKFATGSEGSGSGATLKELMQKDAEGLGKAKPVYASGTDAALEMVVNGKAQVAFFVQSANPKNPRFKYIYDNNLTVIPVISRAMKGLAPIPGTDLLPYELCQDVTIIDGWGSDQVVTTACTPILTATGPGNEAPDIVAALKGASRNDLLPQASAFAKLLSGLKKAGKKGMDAAVELAEQAADVAADKL